MVISLTLNFTICSALKPLKNCMRRKGHEGYNYLQAINDYILKVSEVNIFASRANPVNKVPYLKSYFKYRNS